MTNSFKLISEALGSRKLSPWLIPSVITIDSHRSDQWVLIWTGHQSHKFSENKTSTSRLSMFTTSVLKQTYNPDRYSVLKVQIVHSYCVTPKMVRCLLKEKQFVPSLITIAVNTSLNKNNKKTVLTLQLHDLDISRKWFGTWCIHIKESNLKYNVPRNH